MNEINNHTSHPFPSLTGRVGVGLLYTLLIVCMGIATIIEKIEGKDYVAETIYGSWWFILLWALLAIVGLAILLKRKVHKKLPVFLLHISFVIMLLGALVTHLMAESGTIHLRMNQAVSNYKSADSTELQLPFSMTLKDFEIQTYPGTDSPMDYRCTVSIVPHDSSQPSRDGQGGSSITISMNNIGKSDGYRFYQSSYDSDCQGTILLVAHDPYGIAITYFGYLMLAVSLIWTMFSRHTRIRQLYRMATNDLPRPLHKEGRKPLVVLLLFFYFCFSSPISATQSYIIPHKSSNATAIAHDFGKLVVLYNGRLCPINTAATEFVTKLCGKSSWNGYSADEIFMGWMIYYTEWEKQPIIKVKSKEVQQILGIKDQWASVRDFYDEKNEYKLRPRSGVGGLSGSSKAIRETDEKIQVITMFYNSEMLHMFPLESPKRLNDQSPKQLIWHTPGSTELPLGTPEREFQFINHAMDNFVQCVLAEDVEGAKLLLSKIRLYQKEKAGDVLPSATMVNLEVFYNSLLSARWVVFLCLTLSLLFCVLQLKNTLTLPPSQGGLGWVLHSTFILLQSAYLLLHFVLRWIVSGHVPMSNGFETMLFMALATLLLTLLLMRKLPILVAFGPVVASFCMLVATLASGSPQITQLMPVLQSPLLTIHVALVMMAYALLAIITLISILTLCTQSYIIPHKSSNATALSQLLLYPAVAFLTLGIFIGAVWANISWGTYWSWDPKETWALITLMIYAVPLHKGTLTGALPSQGSRRGLPKSNKWYHLYILLSFLVVLMTYFGVNYFLSGMHSYA